MTLTKFVLSRIAEDEAVARAASTLSHWDEAASDWTRVPGAPAEWVAGDGYGSGAVERTNGEPREVGIVVYDEGSPNEHEAAHIARHDPARVLAECAAYRAIIEAHEHRVGVCLNCRGGNHYEWTPELWPCATLRALATIWADHPTYRPEEWA